MILVADSGSTKTTWATIPGGSPIVTEGLNPHFASDAQVLDVCKAVRSELADTVDSLFFYGAGCGDQEQRQRMSGLLQQVFAPQCLRVETDLLGACRAVCGHHDGLVGILGTGSNICYFDGEKPSITPFSTGYILGDHGSGNHIGRLLLDDYLSGSMPSAMARLFVNEYGLSPTQFMDAVYRQPFPNRFLARIGHFAMLHQDVHYCRNLINKAFCQWLRHDVMPIARRSRCRRLSMVGGIAASASALLSLQAERVGLTVSAVQADPMPGLLLFHSDC